MGGSVAGWILPIALAPFIGSLLGVLVRRLPAGLPVGLARSACESCGRPLGGLDLVPMLSYLALRGRCRHCGARIAPAHLAIELAAVLVAAWAASVVDGGASLWADCGLGWTLLAAAWIDWEQFWLPDVLILPLIPAGLIVTALLEPDDTTDHAIGAAAGYLLFRGVAELYRRLRGRDGLGQGDAKLLAVGGAWLGWPALSSVILLAASLTLAAALAQRTRGGALTATTALPFGPGLAAAIWLVRLYGLVWPA